MQNIRAFRLAFVQIPGPPLRKFRLRFVQLFRGFRLCFVRARGGILRRKYGKILWLLLPRPAPPTGAGDVFSFPSGVPIRYILYGIFLSGHYFL